MQIDPSPNLAIALVALLVLAVVASLIGRLGHERAMVVAGVRAALQLAVVSMIIVFAIGHVWAALAFVALMFGVGVFTTTGRVGARRCWPWTALAMASGALPVLVIIFASGTAPFTGAALIPIGGIVIGNMMTVHTLVGRRIFAALRDDTGTYEAALAIGLPRPDAIGLVMEPIAGESLIPNLDSTRTVGLVTLPGAFIGVLLGGGTPLQAGAAQVLVLVGIMAGQAVTTAVANHFIKQALLLPADLAGRLRP